MGRKSRIPSLSIDELLGGGTGWPTCSHLESRGFVATPPATQSRSVTHLAVFDGGVVYFTMLGVYVKSGYSAGPGVHILVVAPGCKVDVPVVKPYINISDSVSEIPTYVYPMEMSMLGDGFDV